MHIATVHLDFFFDWWTAKNEYSKTTHHSVVMENNLDDESQRLRGNMHFKWRRRSSKWHWSLVNPIDNVEFRWARASSMNSLYLHHWCHFKYMQYSCSLECSSKPEGVMECKLVDERIRERVLEAKGRVWDDSRTSSVSFPWFLVLVCRVAATPTLVSWFDSNYRWDLSIAMCRWNLRPWPELASWLRWGSNVT